MYLSLSLSLAPPCVHMCVCVCMHACMYICYMYYVFHARTQARTHASMYVHTNITHISWLHPHHQANVFTHISYITLLGYGQTNIHKILHVSAHTTTHRRQADKRAGARTDLTHPPTCHPRRTQHDMRIHTYVHIHTIHTHACMHAHRRLSGDSHLWAGCCETEATFSYSPTLEHITIIVTAIWPWRN